MCGVVVFWCVVFAKTDRGQHDQRFLPPLIKRVFFSFYAVILIMATLANDGNGDASTASYDDGEEVHPLDAISCMLSQRKQSFKKALQRYEALAKVDITRIALERTKLEKPCHHHLHLLKICICIQMLR